MLLKPVIRESIERAKKLNLEGVIRRLSEQEDKRNPSPKQVSERRAALQKEISDPLSVNIRLERILQGNELTDIAYLARGLVNAKAVCRIEIRSNGRQEGYGTGFLVAPGVLLTNHHVLPTVDHVKGSSAQFLYERDIDGRELNRIDFSLSVSEKPVIFKGLDMALVAVEGLSAEGEDIGQFGWCRLNPAPGKAFIGEYLTIIQHPNGEHKQICVRENKLLKYSENGPYIWYQTDTVGGSSGSPVFNNAWEVVALHHSSVPRTKRVGGEDILLAKNGKPWKEEMGDGQIDWIANEGVRISSIVGYLKSQHSDNPLARKVITAGETSPTENFKRLGMPGEMRPQTGRDGITRIWIPVEVRVGGNKGVVQKAAEAQPADNDRPQGPRTIEAAVIDQKNYHKRNGYDPKFLGKGMTVPLPKVVSEKFGKVMPVNGRKGELRYWNYSVVMNKARKLAFFSAANVDPDRFRGKGADGDKWYPDKRLTDIGEYAIGEEFYKKQTRFEANRTRNPFDQGHLTRREHLQWGDNEKEAKRNGDDSFHYTNCAPQHWQFNQNNTANGLWYRLEMAAIKNLGSDSRLCTISGPVFDAPISKRGSDGKLMLDVKGKRVKDGAFGGVRIPKQFFKVIAYAVEKELRAKAFVVTQEDLLTTIDRYYPAEVSRKKWLSDLEVRLYQVRLRELEELTGLDFGGLSDSDAQIGIESLGYGQGLPIEDEEQLIFEPYRAQIQDKISKNEAGFIGGDSKVSARAS